jgi:dienelactone hydrolase
VDYWLTTVRDASGDNVQMRDLPGFADDVAPMTRVIAKLLCALLMMLVFDAKPSRAQNSIGPQGPEQGVIRRQAWLIPAQDRSTLMWTTLYRPPGAGAFPLAVINHGSTQNELQRAGYRIPEYLALTEWLVAHGYAVAVPQRPGHGKTGGTYFEDQGGCAKADFRKAGLNTAGSIAAAIDYLNYQPFIRKKNVIAIGQSAGAWGALALASQHYPPLKAVIAFAPGRGGRIEGEAGHNCAPDRLIAAARQFGERTQVPSLWLYAENDSYFRPELSKRLADAYRLAGGRAEYRLLPPVGKDGHNLIHEREGVPLWAPLLERFLRAVN